MAQLLTCETAISKKARWTPNHAITFTLYEYIRALTVVPLGFSWHKITHKGLYAFNKNHSDLFILVCLYLPICHFVHICLSIYLCAYLYSSFFSYRSTYLSFPICRSLCAYLSTEVCSYLCIFVRIYQRNVTRNLPRLKLI